jgi:hypothetical protein
MVCSSKESVSTTTRVAFEVFASRPFEITELATLSLTDDTGTRYTMIEPDPPVLEGHGRVEFRPALPDGALFNLGEPGWALKSYRNKEAA